MSSNTLLSSRIATLNFVDNYMEVACSKYKQFEDTLLQSDEFRTVCRESRYEAVLYNNLLLATIYSILACDTISQCEIMFLRLHCLVYDDWKIVSSHLIYFTDILLPELNQNTENNLLFLIDKLISLNVLGLESVIIGLLKHSNPKVLQFLKNSSLTSCYPRIVPHLAASFLSTGDLELASKLCHWQINNSLGLSSSITVIKTKSNNTMIFIPNIKNFYNCLLPTLLQETILFLLNERVSAIQKMYYHWIENTYNHKHDQILIRFLLKSCNDNPQPGTVKRWMVVLHIIETFPSVTNLMALFQDWLFDLSSNDIINTLDPAISIMIYAFNKNIQLFETIICFLSKELKNLPDEERIKAEGNLRKGMALLVETKQYIPSSKYFCRIIPENLKRLYMSLFVRNA